MSTLFESDIPRFFNITQNQKLSLFGPLGGWAQHYPSYPMSLLWHCHFTGIKYLSTSCLFSYFGHLINHKLGIHPHQIGL